MAVGYRTNSKRAIEFRKWATKTLREHLLKGYTINCKLIAKNYEAFMKSVSDIQALLPEHIMLDPKAILELVKEFSSTWMSLEAYDKDALTTVGTTKKSIMLSGRELTDAVASFRLELMKGGSATEIFAQERATRSIEGIVGNVMQSFGGKPVYESVEERAAHLLYFYGKKSSIHGRQQAKRSVCVYLVFAEGESEKIPQHQSSNSDGFDASYRRKRTKEKGANDRIGNTITEITYQQT